MSAHSEADQILTELHEYFAGRADAEYFTDRASPVPNEEMRLLARVEELQRYFTPHTEQSKDYTK